MRCPFPAVRLALAAGASLFACLPAAFAQGTLLPETVVSASREPLPGARVGSAATVVTGADLEARQSLTAVDILREVPGISVGRTGSFGGQVDVRIRGAESNHTLVLIDGIKVNDPSLGQSFDFSQLPAADIERIEVLRGPQSSLYGSESIGGVVNIVTKRGRKGLEASGYTEAGSFRTLAGGVGARFGGDMLKAAFHWNHLQTAGVSSADRRNGNAESDPFRTNVFSGTASFTPSEYFELSFAGRSSKSLGHFDTFQDGFTIPCQPNGVCVAVDDRSYYKFEQLFGRADATIRLFDGRLTNRTGINYGWTQNDAVGDVFPGAFTNTSRRRKIDNQTSLRLSTPDIANAEHRFTFLFEHERQSVLSSSAFGYFEQAIESKSYVGEYALALWDRLFLTGSVRFDDNDFFQDRVTYRATGAYVLRDWGARLHASAGTGIKNPDLFQLFGRFPGFTPNPNLKSERSFGWDVGVEKSFWERRATVDVTYFSSRLTDRIVVTQQTARNDIGATDIQGIEVAAKLRPLPGLELGGAYTWTDARDPQGQRPVRRAKHIGSAFATYTFLDDRARLHVNARFNGAQRDTVFFSDFSTGSVDLHGYVLLNVAASFKLHENVELYGRIENLLNQKYQEVFSFGTPGIAAFAGLRVRFAALQ
ncbi:MAG: TonB-dependent receptor [Candidatus Odyssella sp.]|nr:TonB-dependent receptor [Candidatus Odyssella sp.]